MNEPLAAQVSLQSTPPPTVTAENEPWYSSGGPVTFAGSVYYPSGPVTHFLRVVRGALLKGQSIGDMWRELAALLAFVCIVSALAMLRYRRTLD